MSGSVQPWWQALPAVSQPPPAAAPPDMATVDVRPQASQAADVGKDAWWQALPPAENTAAKPSAPAQSADRASLPNWAIHDTPQRVAPPQQQEATPETYSNMGGAIPSGLYSGVAKVANLPTYAVNAATNLMSGFGVQPPFAQLKAPIEENPTGYSPNGPWAKGIFNASEAAGNTAALGVAGRVLSPMLVPGSAPQIAAESISHVSPGTVAAAAAGGGAEEPVARNVPESLQPIAKMATNVGVGGAVAGAENALGGAVRGAVHPETAQLAQLARDTYNIPIRAGQITENRIVRSADSALQSVPLSGLRGAAEDQQSSLNRAVSQTFGEDATKITPEVMNAARRRIGGTLNDIEQNNTIHFDTQFQNDLATIENSARSSLTDQEYGVIQRQLDNVLSTVQPGDQIAGSTYGNLIHKGTPLDAMLNSGNPNISSYGSAIRDALRDSLERSLSGDDLAAYQAARTQWKNMKTIEPLTLRADVVGGASPATGDIIPAQLRAVVNRSFKNSAYAEPGQIPLNDLANIAQRFLKETPTSHTAERSNIFRWLERIGAGAGALVGGEHIGLPVSEIAIPAAVAGGATLGAARIAGKTLGSERLANRMIRRGLENEPPPAPTTIQSGVPLLTSSGIRQLEPPAQPQTSRNPATGLPEYSLEANQAAAEQTPKSVAQKLLDGSMATHGDLQDWIGQNRRDLRRQFGGQGIQNIAMVASLLRRAQNPGTTPSTVFSVLGGQMPPKPVTDAIQAAGISEPADLIALAIASPALAKEFAIKANDKGAISPAGQRRLATAIAAAAKERDGASGSAVSSGDGLGDNRNPRQSQRFSQGKAPPPPQVAAQPLPGGG